MIPCLKEMDVEPHFSKTHMETEYFEHGLFIKNTQQIQFRNFFLRPVTFVWASLPI